MYTIVNKNKTLLGMHLSLLWFNHRLLFVRANKTEPVTTHIYQIWCLIIDLIQYSFVSGWGDSFEFSLHWIAVMKIMLNFTDRSNRRQYYAGLLSHSFRMNLWIVGTGSHLDMYLRVCLFNCEVIWIFNQYKRFVSIKEITQIVSLFTEKLSFIAIVNYLSY